MSFQQNEDRAMIKEIMAKNTENDHVRGSKFRGGGALLAGFMVCPLLSKVDILQERVHVYQENLIYKCLKFLLIHAVLSQYCDVKNTGLVLQQCNER